MKRNFQFLYLGGIAGCSRDKVRLCARGLCSADLSPDELKTHITLHGELRREKEVFW